jgi:hypothetical protein
MAEGRRRNPVQRIDVWIVPIGGGLIALAMWIRVSLAKWESASPGPAPAVSAQRADDAAASRAAFLSAYKVLMHPRCNCHQLANLPGRDMPPGNPDWHLPPPAMKMVFQGKSPRELARQLKDPNRNGHKTLDEILHHVAEDTLVLAGWNPGDGRTKPPLSHDEFVRTMREWVDKGAVEPE